MTGDEGVTWLVEPKRPMSVTKFSGTLVHNSRRKDTCSQTVLAFAHFVFGFSKQTLVFADLQGTHSQVKGRDGLVLFDVMTHTIDGNSGMGDFGKKGIQTFVDQHVCNSICKALGLPKAMPLSLDYSEEARHDDDSDNGNSAAGGGDEGDESD
ncbi:hypothetical protein HGRIS_004188 [Hohenbuehelia grisea]|uniref:Alpha-type protein kinase domain-containing protein n=1 Tax=Hohenbuehelia grisea TaxID=104357 RepID=A0ABR3JI47_9AGAR